MVLVGLLLGSFINMAADRLPRRESLVRPRSRCRSCGRRLNAVDLVPVLGYLLRGGRCATCRVAIGVSAPLVEAVSGALVAAAILWQGLWPGAITGMVLVGCWGLAVTALALRKSARQEARGGST